MEAVAKAVEAVDTIEWDKIWIKKNIIVINI